MLGIVIGKMRDPINGQPMPTRLTIALKNGHAHTNLMAPVALKSSYQPARQRLLHGVDDDPLGLNSVVQPRLIEQSEQY